MIDDRFLIAAILIMSVIIINDLLKRFTSIDMDKIDMEKHFRKWFLYIKRAFTIVYKRKLKIHNYVIERNTGTKSLYIKSYGDNKATVMATLRQITGITYDHAKWIINSVPTLFLKNISEDEANLNKKALEFVGAKIEIK